jgi:hypothetical protein
MELVALVAGEVVEQLVDRACWQPRGGADRLAV